VPKEFPDLNRPKRPWPETDLTAEGMGPALRKNMGRFFPGSGDFDARNQELYDWVKARSAAGLWPYGLICIDPPFNETTVRHASGADIQGVNLTAVDYMGMTQHPALGEAAIEAIHEFGVHTPSSGPLMGNSTASVRLEQQIADLLSMPFVFLCPTGWAAAFTALAGVVRDGDHVVMDELSHQCLQQAAYASTRNVQIFKHLDNGHLEDRLRTIRETDTESAILIVTEGLFSMDGDAPDFTELVRLAKAYGALTLVDVAHDLGSLGPRGSGSLGAQGHLEDIDIIAGSFSKAFGTNGGFIANRSAHIQWAQLCFGGPYTYSTAIGPPQIAAASRAFEILMSAEGDTLREQLMHNVMHTRNGAEARGLTLFGAPGPIVPILIGREANSRVAGMRAFQKGLVITSLEFPVVQRGGARFRLSLSPRFTADQLDNALDIIADAIHEAEEELAAG
jgi:glycine C-acetyltransferase